MRFNKHFQLEGRHAYLGASKWHWINYDEETLVSRYSKHMAAQKGTELHAYACRSIQLGIRLPKTNKTLNLYVNDAIGFKMIPEQPLYYSDNCFGTPDTISFRKNFLRIHDYKSGETPASMSQLDVYAALFCLEYKISPLEIEIELRLYQLDKVRIRHPEPEVIINIMGKIVAFDKKIDQIEAGG